MHDKLGADGAVHRRRPPGRRDLRRTRRGGGLALGACRARHGAPRDRRAGERAPAARARAARRDRPGSHLDPARPEGDSVGAQTEEDAERAEADVRALVVQALQDVRALAVELRPSALDDFGLAAGDRASRARRSRSAAASRRSVEANLDERLPPEIETTLYRVVQEALTNVVKHAGAEHVSIVISSRDRSVAATIDDDGRGFDAGRRARRRPRPARDARAARAGRRHPRGRVVAGVRDDDRGSGAGRRAAAGASRPPADAGAHALAGWRSARRCPREAEPKHGEPALIAQPVRRARSRTPRSTRAGIASVRPRPRSSSRSASTLEAAGIRLPCSVQRIATVPFIRHTVGRRPSRRHPGRTAFAIAGFLGMSPSAPLAKVASMDCPDPGADRRRPRGRTRRHPAAPRAGAGHRAGRRSGLGTRGDLRGAHA